MLVGMWENISWLIQQVNSLKYESEDWDSLVKSLSEEIDSLSDRIEDHEVTSTSDFHEDDHITLDMPVESINHALQARSIKS